MARSFVELPWQYGVRWTLETLHDHNVCRVLVIEACTHVPLHLARIPGKVSNEVEIFAAAAVLFQISHA